MPDISNVVVVLLACCLFLLGWITRAGVGQMLDPAVVFPLHWGVIILLIVGAAPLGFYAIQPLAAGLFAFGALMFVLGSFLGNWFGLHWHSATRTDPWQHLSYKWLVRLCVAIHIVMLPIWWREISTIAGESSDLLIIGFRIRYMTVLGEATISSLVGNYLVLGFIMVPVLAVGAFRGLTRGWAAFAISAPWMAANLITNGRASLVQLVLALAYIRATERKPVDLRAALGGLAIFFAIFGGGVLLVAKGNTSAEDSIGDIALGVVTNLADYLLQGPILFSRYLSGDASVVSTWDALVFPCSMLQHAGLCRVGELHQEFADFGRLDQFGNVYSVYFSVLPKYGLLGVVLIIGTYGVWTAFHHRRHLQGASIGHTLVAAYLFSAIPLSIFSDLFAPSLNFLIKTAIVCALLQRFFRKGKPAGRDGEILCGAERTIPLSAARS